MELLSRSLERLGIPCSAGQVRAFSIYLDLLQKWSRAYNLTSLKDESEIILKHFIDSLLYLQALPPDASGLLDVGSGAGFPGVPLKIMKPGLQVRLLEPSRKKAAFLKNLISELSLVDIAVSRCRIEEYPCGEGDPELFDVIVTRALFSAGEFVRKAGRLCRPGGVLIVSKGPSYREELEENASYGYRVVKPDLEGFGYERFLLILDPHRSR